MSRRNRSVIIGSIISALLISLLILLTNKTGIDAGRLFQFGYGTHNLVGASLEEVGQFARQYAQEHLKVYGEPQILLTRSTTKKELAELGMGCISFAAIEEPPLMLVVFKGDFDFSTMPGSGGAMAQRYQYIAYVFDVWSAQPVYLTGSKSGGLLRNVLKDQSIPADASDTPLVCPTEQPAPKSLHYGDVPPTPLPPKQ